MRIESLYRYPVKGLSPEAQTRVALEPGGYWPGDRLFAIENGPSGFDPASPTHEPKIKFLMLMRNESLARLITRFDDGSGDLIIIHEGREALRANTITEAGRAAIADFFAGYSTNDLRGVPRLLTAPDGYRFMDSRSGFVSLINLASVADLEARMDAAIDPLRFRGNLYVDGLPALTELDWPEGTRLESARGVVFEVIKRIDRCAATNVDPATGIRDLQIPKALMRQYGHLDCGVYLRIIAGGSLGTGERLEHVTPPLRDALPMG
ncbi:MAG: MOSC domain-containing protein [Bosea sp. (in: a-proteobacteria)]